MKIAIIGSGISGLVSAYLLHGDHEVTVFEANDYIGGHTHTVDVERDGNRYAVDTGFIVFNEKTYPNFLKLITKLGVAHQPSRMTFSFRSGPDDREDSGHSPNTIFGRAGICSIRPSTPWSATSFASKASSRVCSRRPTKTVLWCPSCAPGDTRSGSSIISSSP